MKKMTSLVLSIVFFVVATLTGCGSANNSGTERTSVTTVAVATQPAVTTQEATTTTVATTAPATTTTTPATTTKEVTTTEKVTEVSTSIEETTIPTVEEPVEPKKVVLDVKNLQQFPEYPLGSAIVSAAIDLNYYGFNCNKSSLMKYITFMTSDDEYGLWGNPNEVFIGSPENNNFGYCGSTVIKNAITSFLNDNGGSAYQVVDITGTNFTDLYSEIDNNNPVIIWASNSMMDVIHMLPISLQNGETFEYPTNYQCVCLVGYDTEMDTIFVCDPAYNDNIVEFTRSSAELVYNQVGKQALVIHKK